MLVVAVAVAVVGRCWCVGVPAGGAVGVSMLVLFIDGLDSPTRVSSAPLTTRSSFLLPPPPVLSILRFLPGIRQARGWRG